jgi:hypothetical protein
MEVNETENGGKEFVTDDGVSSKVESTPEGVIVEAGLNESGSVNSESAAAAAAHAAQLLKLAQLARENGESEIVVRVPEGAAGLSETAVKKIVEAADGIEIVLELVTVVDGEVVGGVKLPLTEESGQILTGFSFGTDRTEQLENFVAANFDTEVLGSFETAQKGGWGGEAEIAIELENLGFEAENGTELFALIYDPEAKKWYEAAAEVIDGAVVFETTRTGIVTIVTESVK